MIKLPPIKSDARRVLTSHAGAAGAVTTVLAGYEAVNKVINWWQDRRSYTIGVESTDEVYVAVQMKLMEVLPEAQRRSMTLSTARNHSSRPFSDEPPREKRAIRFLFAGSRQQTLLVEGFKIEVHVETPEDAMARGEQWAPVRRGNRIVFTAPSRTANLAVARWLQGIATEHFVDEWRPSFYMAGSWGEFQRYPNLGRRALDTVILEDGQKNRLVADLTQFLDTEDDYLRLGLPWHRSFLFHGPPGCGKSSLACALANHFELDVYYLPLGDMKGDTNLLSLVAGVQPRSILVLEDIDIFHAARLRDDDKEGASLSGLLNALDGLTTPHGLITVITTNNIEVLDPALLRPGRVDVIEELGPIGPSQVTELFEMFYEMAAPPLVSPESIAPATVMEAFKRNIRDPEGGARALKALA